MNVHVRYVYYATTAEVRCEFPLLMLDNYMGSRTVSDGNADATCLDGISEDKPDCQEEGSVSCFHPLHMLPPV